MAILCLGAMLLLEASLVAGSLSFVPPYQEPSPDRVASIVQQHAAEWQPVVDPLVTVAGGVQVKSSNVYGVQIDNVRYYYRFTKTFSYDPVSRGETDTYRLVTVIEPGSPFEAEIYRLD